MNIQNETIHCWLNNEDYLICNRCSLDYQEHIIPLSADEYLATGRQNYLCKNCHGMIPNVPALKQPPRTWITIEVVVKPSNEPVAEFSYWRDDMEKDLDPVVRAVTNFCSRLLPDFDLRLYNRTKLLGTRAHDRPTIVDDTQLDVWIWTLLHSID